MQSAGVAQPAPHVWGSVRIPRAWPADRLAPLLPDARAQVCLPDPVVLARLALEAGVEEWRVRNRTEGLPRPLYLRGVNITTPDGVRRTVD